VILLQVVIAHLRVSERLLRGLIDQASEDLDLQK